MKDLRNNKEAIMSYGTHSAWRQMVNVWSSRNRNTPIPSDWNQLVSAVLEYSAQLEWKSWLKEEISTHEQQGKVRSYEISQDQIPGTGHYADVNIQATFSEHIPSLCHTAALNAWD